MEGAYRAQVPVRTGSFAFCSDFDRRIFLINKSITWKLLAEALQAMRDLDGRALAGSWATGHDGAYPFSGIGVNRLARRAFSSSCGMPVRVGGGESTRMASSASLDFVAVCRLPDTEPSTTEDVALDPAPTLDRFLAGVERRAFRIAQMAVRDRDDALDIVQGAMLRLARSYGSKPSEEWTPLFYRILYNGIRDWQRRSSVRRRLFGFRLESSGPDEGERDDPLEALPDAGPDPSRRVMAGEAMERLELALTELPARQQEAFALRCLEGLDVAETAQAMGCSEGSVKTHYFRALQALRTKLGEVW
jgi:RNA polymerase sigma-70 factor (ECF subfamily)